MNFLSTKRDITSEVRKDGFSLVRGEDLVLSESGRSSLQSLSESWNDLPLDSYMPDGATYRERRYGRFYFTPDLREPVRLPNAPFTQSEHINSYAGGLERWFDPLAEQTFANEFLLRLIVFNFSILPIPSELLDGPWEISCQQVRICAQAERPGKPTPEGLHRDGFNFFTLHLIDRHSVRGGSSLICTDDGRTLAEFVLEQPLDSIFVEDDRVLHGVTPIELDNDFECGVRDVLIVNYDYQPGLVLEEPKKLGNFSM